MKGTKARGQATVELAVTTIVFVPLALYVLFLGDLLRHKLDLAEVVFSSAWDYTSVPLDKGVPNLSKPYELTYCDHTSAYNSYDSNFECENPQNHVALAAHACWQTGAGYEANKLKCKISEPLVGLISATYGPFNNGGIASCSAQLGVINYMIPQKILSQFSQVDATRTKKFDSGTNPHAAGAGLAVEDHYLLQRQTFGVLVDTWALNITDSISPDTGFTTPFYLRMAAYYVPAAQSKVGKANDLADALKKDKLLGDLATVDETGDNLMTPHLAYDPTPGHSFDDHTSSGWSDSRVQNSHSARENSYFAVGEGEW